MIIIIALCSALGLGWDFWGSTVKEQATFRAVAVCNDGGWH